MNNTYNYDPYKDNYYNNTRQTMVPNQSNLPGIMTNEEDALYADNILIQNIGKNVRVYTSFDDSVEWRDKVFEGTIEETGTDFLLIKSNNTSFLLYNIYIDYIEFLSPVTF